MPAQQNPYISAQTYLKQERLAEAKSEYLNGEVFAMAGASRKHNQITSNLVVSLGSQLSGRDCSVYTSDMKVRTDARDADKYSYPDVVVACDDEQFEDEEEDVLLNPRMIIEVLSKSTEAYDRGLKFFHYQLIPSLQDYLLVTQHYCRVEHYQRRDDIQWVYSEFHAMTDELELSSLGCHLKVADVYHRVKL